MPPFQAELGMNVFQHPKWQDGEKLFAGWDLLQSSCETDPDQRCGKYVIRGMHCSSNGDGCEEVSAYQG